MLLTLPLYDPRHHAIETIPSALRDLFGDKEEYPWIKRLGLRVCRLDYIEEYALTFEKKGGWYLCLSMVGPNQTWTQTIAYVTNRDPNIWEKPEHWLRELRSYAVVVALNMLVPILLDEYKENMHLWSAHEDRRVRTLALFLTTYDETILAQRRMRRTHVDAHLKNLANREGIGISNED